jgi:hypothetical protein
LCLGVLRMDLNIPLEYFAGASDESLRSFELARLNHASILEKEARLILGEAQRERDAANVARWLLENRGEILRTAGSHLDQLKDFVPAEIPLDTGGQPVAQRPAPHRAHQGRAVNAA